MQEQRIINWQTQALEIMGAALLKNRNNMSWNLVTPTEMIVRCKEDNWKVVMTEAGLFHLYHNNYVVVNQTERRFSDEYHDQNIESANLQELINYIGSYSWDKHLLAKGIEVDRKIYKFRIIENGEISRSKTLKKKALDEYTFIPFKNRIKDIQNFNNKSIKKMIVNILPNGKKSAYEFACAIDEEKKNIYIAEGVFNAHWEHIQSKNVDMSQMNAGEKSAFVGRNHKIQYTGILEPEADTQRLITQRNVALGNDRLQYILSDMDDFVHHKSCSAVEDIKYWEFDAVESYPVGKRVCAKCQKALEEAWRREQLADEYTEQEDKDMTLLYNETIYDKQENDWLQMITQHIDFYSNIEQYMSNLSIEKSKLDQEIEELLEFIEENSCNAAQGFKMYKFLRERRVRRKEIIKELQLLDAWTETIECQQMVQMYQNSIAKMQQIIEKQERKSAVHNFFEEAS